MPSSITYLKWTPIFEWYLDMCGSKNTYQKDTRLKEIGSCTQSMITILDIIIKISKEGGEYIATNKHIKLHFDNEYEIHMRLKNDEESDYDLEVNLDLLVSLYKSHVSIS
jgi:hypothetical protein